MATAVFVRQQSAFSGGQVTIAVDNDPNAYHIVFGYTVDIGTRDTVIDTTSDFTKIGQGGSNTRDSFGAAFVKNANTSTTTVTITFTGVSSQIGMAVQYWKIYDVLDVLPIFDWAENATSVTGPSVPVENTTFMMNAACAVHAPATVTIRDATDPQTIVTSGGFTQHLRATSSPVPTSPPTFQGQATRNNSGGIMIMYAQFLGTAPPGPSFTRDGVGGENIGAVSGVDAGTIAGVDGVSAVSDGGILLSNDPRYMRKAA